MSTIVSSLAIFLLGAAAAGQTPAPPSAGTATLGDEPGFHSVLATNSEKAAGIVDAANQARDAIAQGNPRAARDQVNRAIGLEEALDPAAQKGQLVTIYIELVRMSISAPATISGKGRIAHLATPREKTDIYAGKNQLSTADRMTTVAQPATPESEGPAFTRVSLDTGAAGTHLNAARAALDRDDLKQANRELNAVGDAVTAETAPADVPLLRARQNLAQAARLAQHGDYNTAALSVHAASEALAGYSGAGSKAEEAHSLAHDMQLAAEQDHEQAAGRIESWWERVAQLEAR